jgi:hypothetical protein
MPSLPYKYRTREPHDIRRGNPKAAPPDVYAIGGRGLELPITNLIQSLQLLELIARQPYSKRADNP